MKWQVQFPVYSAVCVYSMEVFRLKFEFECVKGTCSILHCLYSLGHHGAVFTLHLVNCLTKPACLFFAGGWFLCAWSVVHPLFVSHHTSDCLLATSTVRLFSNQVQEHFKYPTMFIITTELHVTSGKDLMAFDL